MIDSLRLYLRYIGISIKSQMQYKASFLMLALGAFVVQAAEFTALWALFDRFKNIRGWTMPEAALLFGMANISFAFAEAIARGFDVFPSMVKTGDFDRLLLRPRSTVLQLIGQELQLMRVGRLTQGLIVLIWSFGVLDIIWTPAKVVFLLGSIAGGVCLFSGLFIIQATMSFWTIESLEIMNTTTYGGVETCRFPLSIYRPWFRAFFTFVIPLACINYIPAMAILDRSPMLLNWISPLVGIIFLTLTLQFWKLGVRKYCSTGS